MSANDPQVTCRELLDHVVGAGDQCCGHFDAERFGGFEIDCELEFDRPYHWQVCRFLTLQDPAGVNADLSIVVHDVRAVAHEAAILDEVRPFPHCRDPVSAGECDKPGAPACKEG